MQSPLPADAQRNASANTASGGKNAGGFDPYFKWLGIPPDEQPPNHYRLLGIPPFTHDADVIENAADQRMAHLRSQTAGQRQSEAQQLLNQVAMAKVSLLTPDKRAAYDAKLKASLKPKVQPAANQPAEAALQARAAAPMSVAAAPVGASPAETLPTFGFSQPATMPATAARGLPSKKDRDKKKANAPYQVYVKPLLIVGSSLLAAIVVVNLVLPARDDPSQDKPRVEKPAEKKESDKKEVDKKEVAVKPAPPPETSVTKAPEKSTLPKKEGFTTPGTDVPKTPDNTGSNDPVNTVPRPNPPETANKVPPPPVDKAKQLREAKEAAIKKGDLPGTLSAIENLADEMKADPLEAQLTFLASEAEASKFDQNSVLIQLLDKMERAKRDGKKELALKYVDRCISLARALEDNKLINRATRLAVQLQLGS